MIAGAGGVDRLNLESRYAHELAVDQGRRALRAERHHRLAGAGADHGLQRPGQGYVVLAGDPGEGGQLGLVRRHQVGQREQRLGARLDRRGIEHGHHPVATRHLQRPLHGVERRFQLHDQRPSLGNGRFGGVDHPRRQPGIGARRDNDHVLAVLGDEDIGDARGDAGQRRDMARIDAVRLQIG